MQLHPQKYKYFPKIRERARENDLNKRLFFGYLRLEQMGIRTFTHKDMEGNKVTINDVARAAGVSKGTVDRVLHNRGEVSAKSKEKVLKVIEELGFKPNLYASLLATQKERVISCIIPEHLPGEFWSLAGKGISDAALLVSRYGIKVETVHYDQYCHEAFRSACASVLDSNPSGVLLAPIFKEETIYFANQLTDSGIPYVFLDTKIEESGHLAYFGMPMYQSGVLCADILCGGSRIPETVYVVRIARDKLGLSDPTASRRAGFMDYMTDHYPQTKIVSIFVNPKDRGQIWETLDETLGADKGQKFIVMFNSRIHIVADYLAARGQKGNRVIGFDMLEKNMEHLKAGNVQALVTQHTDRQAVDAVSTLADYILLGTPVVKKDNFTQMDILTKYNCEYYI